MKHIDARDITLKAKDTEINRSHLPNVVQQIDGFIKKISHIGPKDIVTRNDCKFCKHPLRREAELEWENSKGSGYSGTYARVLRFFQKAKEENTDLPEMNGPNVRRHLINHYEQTQIQIRKREYGEHMMSILNSKVANDQMLDFLLVGTQEKWIDIASDNAIDTLKQADMITKLNNSIMEMIKYQNQLRSDIQAADVVKDKFIKIMVDFIAKESDNDRKNILLQRLEEFQDSVREI